MRNADGRALLSIAPRRPGGRGEADKESITHKKKKWMGRRRRPHHSHSLVVVCPAAHPISRPEPTRACLQGSFHPKPPMPRCCFPERWMPARRAAPTTQSERGHRAERSSQGRAFSILVCLQARQLDETADWMHPSIEPVDTRQKSYGWRGTAGVGGLAVRPPPTTKPLLRTMLPLPSPDLR